MRGAVPGRCPGLWGGQNYPVSLPTPLCHRHLSVVETPQPGPTEPICSHSRGSDTGRVPSTVTTAPHSTARDPAREPLQ